VRVRVDLLDGRVILEVTDNGRGFDPAEEHPGHNGLESMRSRAEEIDGTLMITSVPTRGTVVRVDVAVESGKHTDAA
jgi:signal transduction histidine kinase